MDESLECPHWPDVVIRVGLVVVGDLIAIGECLERSRRAEEPFLASAHPLLSGVFPGVDQLHHRSETSDEGASMNLQPAWSIVSSSPWLLVPFGLGVSVIVTRLYQRIRWAHLSLRGRDPVRTFPQGARALIKSRAGDRCEHEYLYVVRCPERGKLQADHIHPHSRGGSTSLANAQALCPRHNRLKGARIPFTWELRRLAVARRGYFPAGMETSVVRRTKKPIRQCARSVPPAVAKSTPPPGDEPVAQGAEFLSAEDVLALWQQAHGPLDERLGAGFLAHPALTGICEHSRDEVAAKLPHHRKLDDLNAALGNAFHTGGVAGSGHSRSAGIRPSADSP